MIRQPYLNEETKRIHLSATTVWPETEKILKQTALEMGITMSNLMDFMAIVLKNMAVFEIRKAKARYMQICKEMKNKKKTAYTIAKEEEKSTYKKPWSKNRSSCRQCNSDERPHAADDLCQRCYNKKHRNDKKKKKK